MTTILVHENDFKVGQNLSLLEMEKLSGSDKLLRSSIVVITLGFPTFTEMCSKLIVELAAGSRESQTLDLANMHSP